MKQAAKALITGVSLALAFLPALLTGFGRSHDAFICFTHLFALFPGIPGDYLRVAFYHLTLDSCALDSRLSFGCLMAHPRSRIGSGVYIGPYSILGRCDIGARCQIASHVQILAGKHQHGRDEISGELLAANADLFPLTPIGADCWIGAAAIIMADVGDGATIGAGSVVTKPIPSWATAVGSPARVISQQRS